MLEDSMFERSLVWLQAVDGELGAIHCSEDTVSWRSIERSVIGLDSICGMDLGSTSGSRAGCGWPRAT